VIENELAARILLAFDLKEPWSCHQTYKLFDELHSRIFGRKEVDGDRIVTLYMVYLCVMGKLGSIDNQLFARYGLTRFLVLYLLREALETDELGKKCCLNPSTFVKQPQGKARFLESIDKVSQVVVQLIDGEVKRRDADKEKEFDSPENGRSQKKRRQNESRATRAFRGSEVRYCCTGDSHGVV